jgi:hypothetical protein
MPIAEIFLNFVPGQEYLLYLPYVLETNAYSLGGGASAFAISPKTKSLDPVNYRREFSDKDTMLKTARDGAAISAKSPKGGSQ